MTLAEHLAEHLKPRDGFGAIPGPRFLLRSLIPAGKTIEVRPGLAVTLPYEPLQWQTKNMADGSVQLLFTGVEVPRLSALGLTADVTGLLLRVGAEACQVELQLRGWPDIRLTLDLEG